MSHDEKRMRRRRRRKGRLKVEAAPPTIETDLGPVFLPGSARWLTPAARLRDDYEDPENIGFVRSIPQRTRRRWTHPPKMPLWQAVIVSNGQMCGAKRTCYLDAEGRVVYGRLEVVETDTSKCRPLYCRSAPEAGYHDSNYPKPWRCRMHIGGDSAQNRKRRREVLWGRALNINDGESDAFHDMMELGPNLEEEIAMARVRLARYLYLERKQLEAIEADDADAFKIFSCRQKVGSGPDGNYDEEIIEKRVPDFRGDVQKGIIALAKLLDVQAKISPVAGAQSAEEIAAKIREFSQKIDEEIHSLEEPAENT